MQLEWLDITHTTGDLETGSCVLTVKDLSLDFSSIGEKTSSGMWETLLDNSRVVLSVTDEENLGLIFSGTLPVFSYSSKFRVVWGGLLKL